MNKIEINVYQLIPTEEKRSVNMWDRLLDKVNNLRIDRNSAELWMFQIDKQKPIVAEMVNGEFRIDLSENAKQVYQNYNFERKSHPNYSIEDCVLDQAKNKDLNKKLYEQIKESLRDGLKDNEEYERISHYYSEDEALKYFILRNNSNIGFFNKDIDNLKYLDGYFPTKSECGKIDTILRHKDDVLIMDCLKKIVNTEQHKDQGTKNSINAMLAKLETICENQPNGLHNIPVEIQSALIDGIVFEDINFQCARMKSIDIVNGNIHVITRDEKSPFLIESMLEKDCNGWAQTKITPEQETKEIYTELVLSDLENISNSNQDEFAIALDCKEYFENMAPINYLNEEVVGKLKEICFNMELSLRENRYPHRLEFEKIGLPRECNSMVRTLVEDYQQMKDNQEREFTER